MVDPGAQRERMAMRQGTTHDLRPARINSDGTRVWCCRNHRERALDQEEPHDLPYPGHGDLGNEVCRGIPLPMGEDFHPYPLGCPGCGAFWTARGELAGHASAVVDLFKTAGDR